MDVKENNGYEIGDRIDILAGDVWFDDWATIIYFSEDGNPTAEMNRPGHDGCKWAHQYRFETIRHHNQQPSQVK